MDRVEDYIQIMIESLVKKSKILDYLIEKNEKQAELLKKGEFTEINWSQFNILVSEKEAEIARINEMDEGFQALYDHVSGQLKENKDRYADQIRLMQQLIVELEEKSVKIRTGEEKNRMLVEKALTGRKKEIKQARTSLKAAASYYQSMSKALENESMSLDKKK